MKLPAAYSGDELAVELDAMRLTWWPRWCVENHLRRRGLSWDDCLRALVEADAAKLSSRSPQKPCILQDIAARGLAGPSTPLRMEVPDAELNRCFRARGGDLEHTPQ